MTHIEASNALEILSKHQLVDGMPMVIDLERSHGSWIYDACSDQEYLDAFTCFASWPLGYNHPKFSDPTYIEELVRAAQANLSNSDLYSLEMTRFVETFGQHATPDGFRHHFWVSGGSLAVENALKAAFDWKARKLGRVDFDDDVNDLGILHFKQAFHGRSGYTMSLTNTLPDKVGLFPKFDWPRIHNPKIIFDEKGGIANDVEAEEAITYEQIDAVFANGSKFKNRIAAIIIEPMQGEGGDNHFRPEFLQKLRDYAQNEEALLIYDEVQTGFFGSGKPWIWEHHGVAPDLLAFGKKAQVCGFMAGPRIDEVEDNVFQISSRINSTWGGSLVDMVRSRRFMEIIHEDNLMAQVTETGEYVKSGLRAIAQETGAFTNVRGIGSLHAFTFETGAQRDAVSASLFGQKLLGLTCGPRSLRFRLPMIMTRPEVDQLVERVAICARDHVLT